MPSWANPDHKFATFNARSEDLVHKKMFKGAWAAGRRCLIPINAYYEWREEGRVKQPYAIGRKDGKLITLAGLWEGKRLKNGDVLRSFTIITTAANGEMAELHSRIPVMIEEENWAGWLAGTTIDANALLCTPDNDLLETWPVSRTVGNVKNNEPMLVDAIDLR